MANVNETTTEQTVETTQETAQKRFKSPVLWAAVVAQIVSILLMVGVINVSLGDVINQVAGGVLQLGVLIGVLNNPTDKVGW